MKILLVTDSYPPEIRSASHLMLELAEGLVERGYQVSVVTCWPIYNLNKSANLDHIKEFQNENGVSVLRIKTPPHHKINYIIRGLSQLLLPFLFLRKIKQHQLNDADIVIVYSPPLPLAMVGRYFKKKGKKFILNVQDVFPQNAVDLGVLKNKCLIRFFKWMEKRAYCNSDKIITHSDGNTALLKRGYPAFCDKFMTLHNWVDVESYSRDEPRKDFRKLYGIDGDKIVVVFAGVLGPSQNLDFLLSVAEKLQSIQPSLLFLMVGDGSQKARLQQAVIDRNIKNVMFQDFVSREDYTDLLAASDIGLVSLSPKNKTPVVPGKILGYMASAMPIVAFLNKESDGHQIIKEAKCGYSVVSDDLNGAIDVLKRCCEDSKALKQKGLNGYQYAKDNYSKDECLSKFQSLFKNDQ